MLVLFVSVTVLGVLMVPTAWFPKAKVVADRVTWATPVPDRETVCGLFTALSVSVNVAERAPEALGVNVMLIVQDLFRPREPPQVVADWAKSPAFVPLMVMDEIVTTAPVLFVTVTFLAPLVLLIP